MGCQDRARELGREDVDVPRHLPDFGKALINFAVVEIQEAAAVGRHEDRGVAVQLGVLQVERHAAVGDRDLLPVMAGDEALAPVVRQQLTNRRTAVVRNDEREVAGRQAVQERQVEMVLVLVADVKVPVLRRVLELLLDKGGEMVIAGELEPRRVERTRRGHPRIHDDNRPRVSMQNPACPRYVICIRSHPIRHR